MGPDQEQQMLSFFAYSHLPERLQVFSRPFHDSAEVLVNGRKINAIKSMMDLMHFVIKMDQNFEVQAAIQKLAQAIDAVVDPGAFCTIPLRLLLEAKDCAVRAQLLK